MADPALSASVDRRFDLDQRGPAPVCHRQSDFSDVIDDQLISAAVPVLEKLAEWMNGLAFTIVLADPYARQLATWWTDDAMEAQLVGRRLAHGVLCRQFPGGHSSSHPVNGACDGSADDNRFSCYATTITNPVSSQPSGVLTLICPVEAANPVMMAFVRETAGHIEERMRNVNPRRTAEPNGDTVISPPSYRRSPAGSVRDEVSSAGERLRQRLGGGSDRWLRCLRASARAMTADGPILIEGGPGTGKLELATAIHELGPGEGELKIFNAELLPVVDAAEWFREIRYHLGSAGTVVIRRTEVLEPPLLRALGALVDDQAHGHSCGRSRSTRANRTRLIILRTKPGGLHAATDLELDHFATEIVDVPALSERPGDLAELVTRLLQVRGLGEMFFTAGALRAMERAPWPGNISQLDLVVRTAVGGRTVGGIAAGDLPVEIVESQTRPLTDFERIEHRAISQALRSADGNKKAAAEQLGISRSTLYRKLRSLGIAACGP